MGKGLKLEEITRTSKRAKGSGKGEG